MDVPSLGYKSVDGRWQQRGPSSNTVVAQLFCHRVYAPACSTVPAEQTAGQISPETIVYGRREMG